jgi:hypothetical protein
MNEDCDAIEPENCAEHGVEFFGGYRDGPIYATDEQVAYATPDQANRAKFAKALKEGAVRKYEKHDPYEFLYADRSSNTYSTYIGPVFDKDKLFKLLVKACCPVVCKGYRVLDDDPFNSDWHEICENIAHRAMRELGYE